MFDSFLANQYGNMFQTHLHISYPNTLVCFSGKQYNKAKFWVQGGLLLFGKS